MMLTVSGKQQSRQLHVMSVGKHSVVQCCKKSLLV